MINEHDQDALPRCRRLGHEVAFGYCRQEAGGQPCHLILDCWWERFDVRGFLQAHLPEQIMAQVESAAQPRPKVLSLLELLEQTKQRLAIEANSAASPWTGSEAAGGREEDRSRAGSQTRNQGKGSA